MLGERDNRLYRCLTLRAALVALAVTLLTLAVARNGYCDTWAPNTWLGANLYSRINENTIDTSRWLSLGAKYTQVGSGYDYRYCLYMPTDFYAGQDIRPLHSFSMTFNGLLNFSGWTISDQVTRFEPIDLKQPFNSSSTNPVAVYTWRHEEWDSKKLTTLGHPVRDEIWWTNTVLNADGVAQSTGNPGLRPGTAVEFSYISNLSPDIFNQYVIDASMSLSGHTYGPEIVANGHNINGADTVVPELPTWLSSTGILGLVRLLGPCVLRKRRTA